MDNENTNDFSNLINPYTNKPVQTGQSVSFNQRIYNDTNYIQAKNNLLNEFNLGMTQPSKNKQALYDIPVVPEFMSQEYQEANQAANWLNSLNIASPEEIDEWRAKGKIGLGETIQKLATLKSAKYVPFVGTTAEVGYNLDMLATVNRLKKGEKVSQAEQDLLVDYLRELKEIQVRGTTLPSKALNAILESIPFMVEFGVGVAGAGETLGGSLSVSAAALSKAAGKKAAQKAVQKVLTEATMTNVSKQAALKANKAVIRNAYESVLQGGTKAAIKEVGGKEAAKIIAKKTPESIVAANFGSKALTYMTTKNTIGGVADRQLAGSVQVTDAGEAVFMQPENIALSIMKSFGSAIFDNYTETMGWAFAPVTSYFAKPLRNILPKKFFTEFEKLVTSRYGMPATQALKKYGYDGVVEEMGEELLNRFLCQTFGINGLEDYTFDGFMNNVFYANDPEQWLVEALSFAIMGAGAHGTHGAASKIKEELQKRNDQKSIEKLTELANKRLFSPAEFYLEQGLIKIEGSQSLAEQELRKKFSERGIDNATADEFINNSSELEIRNELKKFIDEDAADSTKRREKAVDMLANKMLESKGYKSKEKAEKNANLIVTALEKFSETNDIPIEQLIADEAPTIREQTEEVNEEAAPVETSVAENKTTLSGINEVREFAPEEVFSNTNIETSDNIQHEIKESYDAEDVVSQEELEAYYAAMEEADAGYTEEVEEDDILLEEEKLAEREEKEQEKQVEEVAAPEITEQSQEVKTETETTQEIQDVGDSLLGNLKRNGKTYTWEELESMNDLLRTKYVAKRYIMPKPEFEELLKQGYSEKTAAFVINVYNRINAKPAKGYDKLSDHKIYFDGINNVMANTLRFAKEEMSRIDNFKAGDMVDKTLLEWVYPDTENKKPYNIFTSYPEHNKSAIITGGNKMISAMYLCRDTENDIKKILESQSSGNNTSNKTENKVTGWETTFTILEFSNGIYRIAEKKSRQMLRVDFSSKEKAEYAAEKLYEAVKKERYGFTVSFADMRDYIPRRENNQNVKPEALIQVFGFRGVNFGNWTKQSERQEFINLAYDSLYDLAELLNLPPKAMSLNGKLGLAFGAQGRGGKAAGHFLPEFNEINMTRKQGAGTLAHEWWHALDYYFGDLAAGKDFSGKASTTLREGGKLRPELFAAIQNLNTQIRYAPITEEELEQKKVEIEAKVRKGLEYYGNNIKQDFKKLKNFDELNSFIDEIVLNPEKYGDDAVQRELMKKFEKMIPERRRTLTNLGHFSWLLQEVGRFHRITELAERGKKNSEYYENSAKVDDIENGKGYWTSTKEMSARAFSTYLLDKMEKSDFSNGFLVRSQAGEYSIDPAAFVKAIQEGKDADSANILVSWNVTNPEERQRVFDAFDMIFKTVKYEETDKGYRLYQSAEEAGAETQSEIIDAKREWQEKGTDSSYFRKWFGDSQVVDENGQPLVVYHGTDAKFEVFEPNDVDGVDAVYFSDSIDTAGSYSTSGYAMSFYLKMDNPYIYSVSGQSYNEAEGSIRSALDYAINNNYDGVIIKDIIDDAFQEYEEGVEAEISNTYIVFKPEQIKSVNNNGTFDADNPNIYYQSAYHGTPHDFDEFSTENIGTGEGAQAHGYGLYFAEDKEIAQEYHDKLSGHDYYYNGQRLFAVNDINNGFIKRIIRNGKEKTIESLENEKQELEKNLKNSDNEIFGGFWNINAAYKYQINAIDKKIDFVKNFDENKYEVKRSKGQLFKVDIPEADVLLDENEPFSIQTEKVQNSIKQLISNLFGIKDFSDKNLDKKISELREITSDYKKEHHTQKEWYIADAELDLLKSLRFDDNTGRDIYTAIVSYYKNGLNEKNAEKLTSELLNKYGIKGITYNGREDGRCYVVFDDKAIEVVEKYYQEVQQENLFIDNLKRDKALRTKGYYMPAENLIELLQGADESTVVHEFAHWWLDRLVKYSEGNEELTADVEAVRAFLKNNGEPFTREQHEKFAKGFEAYIRSGYAKNNRLKKIFEDFKNALLAIYDSIKQLGYNDDDLPQLQSLFDRLLTTEHERIRATVFDKIAEIDSQIEAIKKNEEKEFAELDTIYKDNIAILNRKSERKRSVKQYLELAEQMTSRESKEVKEYKKRYKDVTLSILEVATGYKRQFIANPKNWEKVQEKIANIDDPFSGGNGMQPEWTEFYADTGVSYETDEVGGDYKLAEQAFDVLVNDSYSRTYNENYEFAEIEKFIAKFDYIAAKVKTVKGEEKNVAYEALAELFGNMPSMPDEVMSDLAQKLLKVGEEFEADQKEDFNRKSYPTIPVVQQLQFFITNKLNELKVYNPETRYKMRLNKSHRLYRYIKNVTSVNSAKKQIRRINEFVIDDMRNNQRSLLHKEIQKQLRLNSKVVKIGTMKKGKFDWKTNTIFAELVEMNKLDPKEAEKQLGIVVSIQDAAKGEARDSFEENETAEFNKTNDFQDNLKKKFLQYRSMRLQDLDVTHTIQLLQDILELKEKGRKAKSEEDFINKTQKWNTKNNLLDILEITKNSGAKYGANWVAGVGRFTSLNGGVLANWESLLNAIFNKDIAQKYSLLKDEADAQVYARKNIVYFHKKAAEIYGFKQPNNWDKFIDYDYLQPLIKLFQEYDKEKYTYIQRVHSINSPNGIAQSSIEISRSQMITMYAWGLNEKLEQRLFTQFGLEQIREMFENVLSEQDRQLAWALIDTCEQMREDINEVFIRTTGLSLPAVENYFPSKAERVQSDIDMYHDFFVKSSNPSFIKERKTCNRIPMKPMSPLEILIPHINKIAKYVVMSEKVNFLNQVFKDTAIKTKMQEVWGSDNGSKIYQTLINKLAASTFTNYSKGTNLVAGALDGLSRNYITSAIGFSAKVTIGQLLSVVNYAENMPAAEWSKGFAQALKNPVQNFKYMIEHCEYLQARLGGNSQNEIIEILTSEKDKFRTLRNFMTSNTKWGDIIAITLGGKPYVDYLIKQGMTEEEAFEKFTEDTLRAQQASSTSSISEWQSAQAKNCLTRMLFAFQNTSIQYERKFVDTLIQAKKGEISKGEAMKKLFIYKVLNPFMFTSFLQNLSVIALIRSIFAGDDPEDYTVSFLNSIVEAAALSGLGAYGFAGFIASSVIESIIALLDKDYKHFEKNIPVYTDFNHQMQKLAKGDLEFADYVEAVATASEWSFGVPSTKVLNFAGGVGNIAQGEPAIGLSRMAGWGNYTATKAWTGEAPEKKKKRKRK